jgi:hypothetical protein
MERQVQPELLDELPPDDRHAVRSRHDLRRVNGWMNHARIIARLLQTACSKTPHRIVDLGGGDGTLMLEVARRLPSSQVALTIVDRQNLLDPGTASEFAILGWNAAVLETDVLDWAIDSSTTADLIVANLFLHHFKTEPLRVLLQNLANRTPFFIACEPRRFSFGVFVKALLWLIRCNAITRHDGEISVRAGFRGRELSTLWPRRDGWLIEEKEVGMFSHCFVARRLPPPALTAS